MSVNEGAGCYTTLVSWVAPQATFIVRGNYSVRYKRTKGGGGYTTVHSSTTSVTLEDITANAEYDVSVAYISSAGDMGIFTEPNQFILLGDFCTTVTCHVQS